MTNEKITDLFIARLIDFTLKSSEKFAEALLKSFKMPDGISNEYLIFLRGPEIKFINMIPTNVERCWLSPKI